MSKSLQDKRLICPKTGRPIGEPKAPRFVSKWLFPVSGLLSLIWIIFRVVSKPSRASYPCVKAAEPLAGGFLAWAAALGTSIALRHHLKRRTCMLTPRIIFLGAGMVTFCTVAIFFVQLTRPGLAETKTAPHLALGIARGFKPGRVVWVHNPAVTDWAGPKSGEKWYERTDRAVAEAMVSSSIRAYAGTDNDVAAWEQIFTHFNHEKKRRNGGYHKGERIAIKINLSTCNAGGNTCDDQLNKIQLVDNIDNSPQILHALLEQLVQTVGVDQKDITIGDPTAIFPNYLYNYLHQDFPNVAYWDNEGTHGRMRAEFSKLRFYWSTKAANDKTPDYLPQVYADASYVINAAVLKGHSAGVTLCAKNNYGSLIRTPNGQLNRKPYSQNYYDLHLSLPNAEWSPGMGKYRALVDLMGQKDLGGKTLLYLVDGLFGGYYWDAVPRKWHSPPFNGNWPSSIFVSMDPVAIDSVCYDFIRAEWPDVVRYGAGKRSGSGLAGGAEDYLHEAALANRPPSGTLYDPEKDGEAMESLGVHEHWNNAKDKQYSRDSATGDGIELVKIERK